MYRSKSACAFKRGVLPRDAAAGVFSGNVREKRIGILMVLPHSGSSMSTGRYKRLAKEGSWVLTGQLVAVAGSLALVRVLTEYLEPEQYGELALGLTVAGLVNQVVMGGITTAIGRFYSIAHESRDLAGYIRHSIRLMGYGTIAALVVAFSIIAVLFLTGYAEWIGLAAAALVFSILGGYTATLSGVQNAARQRSTAAIHGGLDAWLRILFAVGAILWLGSSSTIVILGYSLASLLICISQFFFLKKSFSHRSEHKPIGPNWSRQMWGYSWPFSVWGLFSWAQQASDRWALQFFGTTEGVGQYAVLFQLGYAPVGMAAAMVVTLVSPILYQRAGDATDQRRNAAVHVLAWRVAVAGLLLTALGFGLAMLLHDWIFDLLVAAEYHEISALLPWMVLAGGIFASGQVLALKLMSDLKSAAMTTAKVSTAILGVVLNFFGASLYGVDGVAAAVVIFSAIYLFWMAWLAKLPTSLIDSGLRKK